MNLEEDVAMKGEEEKLVTEKEEERRKDAGVEGVEVKEKGGRKTLRKSDENKVTELLDAASQVE